MLRSFCIVSCLLFICIASDDDDNSAETCKNGPCILAHLAVPRDGMWFFGPTSRFEGVVIARNLPTSREERFEVFLDGESIATGFVTVGPSSQIPEADVTFQLPPLTPRGHTLRFVVLESGGTSPVSSMETHFEVLEPPRALLSFPQQGQRFSCPDAAGVTLFFTFDLTYDLSADFLEAGAGFLGAAAIVDGQRSTCVLVPLNEYRRTHACAHAGLVRAHTSICARACNR